VGPQPSVYQLSEDRWDVILWLKLDGKMTLEEIWSMTEPEIRRFGRALDRRNDRLEQARRSAR
jgi:hypothetical protein